MSGDILTLDEALQLRNTLGVLRDVRERIWERRDTTGSLYDTFAFGLAHECAERAEFDCAELLRVCSAHLGSPSALQALRQEVRR